MSSVFLSACLLLRIIVKLYILQQCLKLKLSALLGTRRYNFQPPTPTLSPKIFYPQNSQHSTKKNAYLTWRTLCSRDAHADHVILLVYYFQPIKISNSVRSAMSATAGQPLVKNFSLQNLIPENMPFSLSQWGNVATGSAGCLSSGGNCFREGFCPWCATGFITLSQIIFTARSEKTYGGDVGVYNIDGVYACWMKNYTRQMRLASAAIHAK